MVIIDRDAVIKAGLVVSIGIFKLLEHRKVSPPDGGKRKLRQQESEKIDVRGKLAVTNAAALVFRTSKGFCLVRLPS
jgi:hypothetical protein